MAEVEFTIDTATGELKAEIHGVIGPSCGDVARLVQELVGQPTVDEKTQEFHQAVRPVGQVRR